MNNKEMKRLCSSYNQSLTGNMLMNTERLLELLKLLDTIPNDNLDLSTWAFFEDIEDRSQQQLIDCGTTCCAVGWACSHPPFMSQGLRWSGTLVPSPTYLKHSSWDAVEAFFEINNAVAIWLFSESSYPSEYSIQDVRQRIKEIIEDEDLYDQITQSYI